MRKLKLKKILIITGVVLIVLWFGANGAMYLYIVKTFINPDNEKYMNSTPESMVLDVPPAEGVPIELMGIQMNLPLMNDKIEEVWVSFWDHEIWMVSIHYSNEDIPFEISFEREIRVFEGSSVDRICSFNYSSGYEVQRSVQNASLDDFSLWNIPCNYWLSQLLILKAISSPMHYKAFELKTPYLQGFMLDGSGKDSRTFSTKASFLLEGNSIDISFSGVGNKNNEALAKAVIASMRPAEGELPILGEQLSEELALVLQMDKEGITVERLERLRNIMEEKGYLKDVVSDLNKEIEEFKGKAVERRL